MGKNINRNTVKRLLIKLINLFQMHLKLLQKEQLKNPAEAPIDLIDNKST